MGGKCVFLKLGLTFFPLFLGYYTCKNFIYIASLVKIDKMFFEICEVIDFNHENLRIYKRQKMLRLDRRGSCLFKWVVVFDFCRSLGLIWWSLGTSVLSLNFNLLFKKLKIHFLNVVTFQVLSGNMCLVVTILHSTDMEHFCHCSKFYCTVLFQTCLEIYICW